LAERNPGSRPLLHPAQYAYAIAPFYEEVRPAWPISAWRPVLGATLAAKSGWATLGNWNPPSIRAELKLTP